MPNTSRGGGISKKITMLKDRLKLKKIIEECFKGQDSGMRTSALTVVISLMSLRRNIGTGRAAILRQSADFMVTICGVPGKMGWVGLRYCCPWCGYVPFGEQGWFVLEGAGQFRLISLGALTHEQQQRWFRQENDPHHGMDLG